MANTKQDAAVAEVAQLVERVRGGDVRALARAISLVENASPVAVEILAQCFPQSGNALRVGVTGSPGAGKSTLVDGLARGLRAQGKTIGVLAVDPTSPFTGGAILGDRIRMQDHFNDPSYPKLHFIEHQYSGDWTNWWAPNAACSAAMLRSSGFEILEHPEEEVFVCRRVERPTVMGPVYPAKVKLNGSRRA